MTERGDQLQLIAQLAQRDSIQEVQQVIVSLALLDMSVLLELQFYVLWAHIQLKEGFHALLVKKDMLAQKDLLHLHLQEVYVPKDHTVQRLVL